jgi:phosphatidylinositol-bisphosphatase
MGKDHFIAVTAKYGTVRFAYKVNSYLLSVASTCFANKLSRLTRLPGPIRSLTSPTDLLAEDRAINAPREIMRLVNWMMAPDINIVGVLLFSIVHSSDMDQEHIFTSTADKTIVDTIREVFSNT